MTVCELLCNNRGMTVNEMTVQTSAHQAMVGAGLATGAVVLLMVAGVLFWIASKRR